MASCIPKRRNLLNNSVVKCFLISFILFALVVFFLLRDMRLIDLGFSIACNLFGAGFWLKNRKAEQHFGLFPFYIIFYLIITTCFFFLGCIFLFDNFAKFFFDQFIYILLFSFCN